MNIEPINSDSIKFNTCKFRSENPITQTVKRCSCRGGDYQITAYFCNKRQLFQITEDICKNCEFYESK
jgi:hypothetical protein